MSSALLPAARSHFRPAPDPTSTLSFEPDSAPGACRPERETSGAELSELRRLADRAELWATIAPGLGHHLANALMSLSVPSTTPRLRESAHARVQSAHRALLGLCQDTPGTFPVDLSNVIDMVDSWQKLQLGLPACVLERTGTAAVALLDDGRVHHALIAIVTLAKSAGVARLELRAQAREGGCEIQIDEHAEGPPLPTGNPERRREEVVRALAEAVGGGLRLERDEDGCRRWRLRLPLRRSS